MNDFNPTHQTKPGVEVRIYGDTEDQADLQIGMIHYAIIPELIALLFESIPKPVKMIEIPLDIANSLHGFCVGWRAKSEQMALAAGISAAIRDAEQENAVVMTLRCTRSEKP